jgi:hypothetical protein
MTISLSIIPVMSIIPTAIRSAARVDLPLEALCGISYKLMNLLTSMVDKTKGTARPAE